MADKISFTLQGIEIEVAPDPELGEAHKTLTGEYEFPCPCGTAKMRFKESDARDKEQHSEKYGLSFTALEHGKYAVETLQKAPRDNLIRFMQSHARAMKLLSFGAASHANWSFILRCPVCGREFYMAVAGKNPLSDESEKWSALEMARRIPFKRDGFTRKALARLALAQGFKTPEAMVDHVEALLHDVDSDSWNQAVKIPPAESFKTEGVQDEVARFNQVAKVEMEKLRKGKESELGVLLRTIYNASDITFGDDEAPPEGSESLLSALGARLSGNKGSVLFSEDAEKKTAEG